ncbi:DedA family protein [Candidatus Stoquefichus massiliensis]|uniref:DedA family protein n=1 Tax=Candidatus Stoquefichus massiliensis TaxID=1470350 RepID=UPI00048953C7|nr:DedA family protein [Candidatus Stoquefichus massiliensis]
MQEWITMLIQEYGYISLFVLMIIENVFPPIPSEVILTFAGFMTAMTYLTIPGVIIVGSCGSFLGGFVLYYLGRLLTPSRLENLLNSKWAIRLHFHKEDVKKTQDWFLKHGKKAVFFGRLVPMIRSLISIPAGMAQMSFVSYSLYTLLGTLLWDTILVLLGTYLGEQWPYISTIMSQYDIVWKGIIVIIVGYWIFKYFSRKDKR